MHGHELTHTRLVAGTHTHTSGDDMKKNRIVVIAIVPTNPLPAIPY